MYLIKAYVSCALLRREEDCEKNIVVRTRSGEGEGGERNNHEIYVIREEV